MTRTRAGHRGASRSRRPATRRPGFGRAVGGALLAACLAAGIVPVARAAGIAVIKSRDLDPYNRAVAGFRAALPSGWIQYDLGADDSNVEFVRQALQRQAPEVLVAVGPRAARLAHQAAPRAPLVCALVDHGERLGLDAPGVCWLPSQVDCAALARVARLLVPSGGRLGMVTSEATDQGFRTAMAQAAARHNLEAVIVEPRAGTALAEQFRVAVARADVLWFGSDPATASPAVFEFARRTCADKKVPMLVFSESLMRPGVLAAVGLDAQAVGRLAARLARQAMDGRAVSGEQPVEQAAITIALSLRVASELALELPKSTLAQVHKVVP
ncbi:MAG: hypothetical protein HZB25_11845 [Candidatus Eisenbacteria bacterium]|nr:hypothetical protein [Candidatus Eisenbacteria bacterium]